MFIIDTALERREREGKPVRVALVGAGYMGRGIALETISSIRGLRLVAIANRTLDKAGRAFREAEIDTVRTVETSAQLDDAIARGEYAIADDPAILSRAEQVDVIIEATGQIELGAQTTLDSIRHGKHVVLMNAELDATIGPILKIHADRAGVVLTNTDGDEPGVAMNLFRFVKTIGYHPVLAGNLKGFIDPYRTPDTQRAFAEKVNQKPPMITSFADGTKLAMEATILANATGFKVGKRGMYGHSCGHVKEIINFFDPQELLRDGLVDFALGAEPGTGAFVVGYCDHPTKQQYMSYFKMGDGPLYVFYTPYHLPHIQISLTVARAALFHDPTVAPIGAPRCDVITVAKRNLRAGEVLDGIGGYTGYGVIENADVSLAERLLPMGLSDGCRLTRDIARNQVITYDDVVLPERRLADQLRAEQVAFFSTQ